MQSFSPSVPPTVLRAAVAVSALGIRGRDPIVPRLHRLKAGLVSGYFVKQGAPFEQAVDNSLARRRSRGPAGSRRMMELKAT